MHRLVAVARALTVIGCGLCLTACPSATKTPPASPERRVAAPARALRPAPARRVAAPARARRPKVGTHTIGGWRLEVLLVPERATFMAGEPIFLSFKVHNHSKEYLQIYDGGDTRNRLSRPESYRVRVKPVGGADLPVRDAGPSKGGLAYPRRMLPDDGFSRELFLPNWALITRPGQYEIRCTRVLHVDKNDPKKHRPKKGERGVSVTARALVTITAASPKRMGKLITELAEIMRGSNWASIKKAARALAAIRDPRIVGHFVRAIKQNRHQSNLIAARVFGRFTTAPALAGLKLCKGHRTLAVRRICAESLARSRHPKAWALLLALRDDEDKDVRLTVLRALGKKGCGKATLKLIRKLSADDVAQVKKEAKRFLQACRKRRRP